jgi:hypothetical protein
MLTVYSVGCWMLMELEESRSAVCWTAAGAGDGAVTLRELLFSAGMIKTPLFP